MSRIEQAFQDLPKGKRISDIALHIARRICDTQKQDRATVELSGEVIVRRDTAVTGLPNYNTVTVIGQATAGDVEQAGLGLRATIMSACPCMQTYSLDELARTFDLTIDDPKEVIKRVPIATHSQKGSVRAVLSGVPGELEQVSLDMLYQIFGSATHLTSELLKRPDEYDMVRRAHLRPQFVEDVVRDVLSEIYTTLGEYPDTVKLNIEAESYESIHGHDIQAETSLTLAQLRTIMGAETVGTRA